MKRDGQRSKPRPRGVLAVLNEINGTSRDTAAEVAELHRKVDALLAHWNVPYTPLAGDEE